MLGLAVAVAVAVAGSAILVTGAVALDLIVDGMLRFAMLAQDVIV
jgi:hypothetical protein